MAAPFPRSRFVSVFLGGALGDSLGAPVEFSDTPEIERKFPQLTLGAATLLADAHLTDDTQTTLWVAEGLIRAHQRKLAQGVPSVEQAVRDALLRWYVTQEPGDRKKLLHAENGRLLGEERIRGKRSPDNTNLLALGAILHSKGWKGGSVPEGRTESPGALMRSAPYAVLRDVEECYEYAVRGATITHPHPEGHLPAGLYAALLHGLVRDMPFADAYERALALMESSKDADKISVPLEAALKSPSPSPDIAAAGGGWTAVSALCIALCVFKAGLDSGVKESSQILLNAVLHSGKSDTVGALVGQLLAAHFGPTVLPKDWLSHIEARGTIEGVASDLFDAWVVETQHELEPYPVG